MTVVIFSYIRPSPAEADTVLCMQVWNQKYTALYIEKPLRATRLHFVLHNH